MSDSDRVQRTSRGSEYSTAVVEEVRGDLRETGAESAPTVQDDGLWARLIETRSRFQNESQKSWWLYVLVFVVTLIFQDYLARAADSLISAVNASGVSADVVRGLIGPIGAVALLVMAIAAHAYLDTRAVAKRATGARARTAATEHDRARRSAIAIAISIADDDALQRALNAVISLQSSQVARRENAARLGPDVPSFEHRMQSLLEWSAGREQLMYEGEELARVLRGLRLKDSDDGYHKDLVSSAADRRAQGWIKDVDEFEDYWVGGSPLATGPIRRFVGGLTYKAALAPKPVWRQRRVREIELRLERLSALATPSGPRSTRATADGTAANRDH